jgi:hypothetical protein
VFLFPVSIENDKSGREFVGAESFYVSGLVSELSLIIEELKTSELLTEDSKGRWALVQLEAAIKSLFLWHLIIPIEKGGVEVPVLKSQEAYMKVFLGVKNALVAELEMSFPVRKRHRDKLLLSVEAKERELEELENAEVEEPQSQDAEDIAVYEAQLREKEEAVETQQAVCDKEYTVWRVAQAELHSDQQKVVEWESATKLRAMKQHRADSDALLRVQKALGLLKKYLQGLMVRVPSIVGVVRKMCANGVDPYVEGDMRRCYANMVEHFRKSDELGVATSLMSGMRLQQSANQSLRQFVRKVEEFHQNLVMLGVKSISTSDLAAMVAIGGMHDRSRVAFLKAESALALALDNLEEDGESMSVTGSETLSIGGGSARRASRKALLAKVLSFVDSEESNEMLNQGLGKGAPPGGGAAKEGTTAERKVQAEARAVLSVREKGVCHRWIKDGVCEFGKRCFFAMSHTTANKPTAAQPPLATEVNSLAVKKGKTSQSAAARALFPLGVQWSEVGEDSEEEDGEF